MNIAEVCRNIQPVDSRGIRPRMIERLNALTKPAGSLGRLEELAIRLAEIQSTTSPRAARKLVVVMAADHGVCEEGVSAYPAAVTAQMLLNFVRGGAAINVLARHAGARVLVVDMGVGADLAIDGFLCRKVAPGTQNFLRGPAMTLDQAEAAVTTGIEIAREHAQSGLDVIAGGDMGIGNTTASSVITALVTGAEPSFVVGRGTGVDDTGLARKRHVVERAVELHRNWHGGLDLLRLVGGFEIAGLAGLILGAAEQRIPFILDGFISTAAALVATQLSPAAREYLMAAHCSAEPGHRVALEYLQLRPLLDWELRLGEGTGAALVFPLLEASCKVVAEMATFASAGVSGKTA